MRDSAWSRSWLVVALAACSGPSGPSGGGPDAAAPDAPRPTPDAAVDAQTWGGHLYPDPDWATGTPEEVGIDPAAIETAATAAAQVDSYCLLVVRHGKLVAERYFNGSAADATPNSWSIAKTYTSTTVGIALANQALPSLDMKVSDHITAWAGTDKADITLRHLVTMTSGLEHSILKDYVQMAQLAQDKSEFAVGLGRAEPAGSKWVYHNGGVQVVEPLFRAATGTSIEDYARTHLWSRIGMSTASWAHDGEGHPTTYANVLATCRDQAKFGYLYLRNGRWKDDQVIPAAWVAEATTPSQALNRAYGYLLWLNGQAPRISATGSQSNEPLYDYAPDDLFGAHGFGGQLIDVIPSLDMVIVRMGRDPLGMSSTNPLTVGQAMIADQMTDRHRQIVGPIVAGTN